MNISEVAERVGLPAKTIRYYDEIGLVQAARNESGYRVFSPSDLHNLNFLARARGLGFSIEDCRALLALYADKTRASGDVKRIAQGHLDDISAKIEDLISMRDTLSELVQNCAGNDRPDCPILHGLEAAPSAKIG